MSRRYINFIAGIAALVVVFGTIYAVGQQAQRDNANYPQIQMAEDAAAQIKAGHDPHISSTLPPVDMDSSLAPFTLVYDAKGKVVSGSGYLGGKVPAAPLGLLQSAKGKDYNAQTWQPKDGVRIAAVTVTADKYYVLSGRSLTEVEKNENHTFWLAFMGGVLAMLILVVAIAARSVVPARP